MLTRKSLCLCSTLFLLTTQMLACAPAPSANTNPEPSASPTVTVSAPVNAQNNVLLNLQVQEVTKQAFSDPAYKAELIANPVDTLKAANVTLSDNAKIKVLDYSSGNIHLVLDDRNLTRFHPKIQASTETSANETSVNEDSDNKVQQILQRVRTQAQTDASYKANLIKDPATVLTTEGIDAKVAELFRIQDYEADTDFLLILPPDQQGSRAVYELAIRPLIIVVKNLLVSGIKNAVTPEIVRTANDLINAACYFPRVFGQQCGASDNEIKSFLLEEAQK